MSRFLANLSESHRAFVDFLRAEVQTGMVLVGVANRGDDASRDRNRQNARRAYEALLRFRHRALLTDEESEEINAGIATLKTGLEQLGERFLSSR